MTRWAAEFVLLAAIWGASFLFTRVGVLEFGVLPTACVRVAIASAFLLPLLAMRGQVGELKRHWKTVLLIGVFSSGIPFACFAFAVLSITTGLSSILNATTPLFAAIVAWLWLKDRPTGLRLLGLVIGFAGIAMLAWDKAAFKPDASGIAPGWAVLACLLATVCYAISANAAKRFLSGVPALVTATGSQVGATLALAVPAALLWPASPPSAHAWLALLTVGVLCTGIAYVLYFRLIDSAGASKALTVTFLIPVFAVFYGVVFLDEVVTAWMLFWGAVVVFGTALSTGLLQFGKRAAKPA